MHQGTFANTGRTEQAGHPPVGVNTARPDARHNTIIPVPNSFVTLEQLPPLRMSASELASVVDNLIAQLDSGGDVTVEYVVSLSDGARVTRADSAGFVEAVTALHERPESVVIWIHAWSPRQHDEHGLVARDIVRSVSLQLRNFGSQFTVSSSDVLWGKGAVQSICATFKWHSPWFAPFLRVLPVLFGVLLPLPIFFVLVAIEHVRKVTVQVGVVVGLSALFFVVIVWLATELNRARIFPHTLIVSQAPVRSWRWLRFLVAAVAFLADVAVLVDLITR